MTETTAPKFSHHISRDVFLGGKQINRIYFDLYLCGKSYPEEPTIQLLARFAEGPDWAAYRCSLPFRASDPKPLLRLSLWSGVVGRVKTGLSDSGETDYQNVTESDIKVAMEAAYGLAKEMNFGDKKPEPKPKKGRKK